MTLRSDPTIHCDRVDCNKTFRGKTDDRIAKGWVMRNGHDFCPDHAANTCTECGREWPR